MQDFSNRVYEKLSKLSKSQIERVYRELKNHNEILNSIVQSLSTGLVTVDRQWHLLEMNKAAERLLPFHSPGQEFKFETQPFFELIDDKDMAEFFQDCFQKNKTNISDEYTVSTSGGSVRFIKVCVIPLVAENQIAGSIILVEDITERRSQEILLHRMETMAGLTNIAANVAHEIKNPLGAISIHIQLLQKAISKHRKSDGRLPEQKFAEDCLDIVNQEIDRLNKIVVDFLMAVRPVSAQLVLVKPDSILEKFIQFITPEFSDNKIKIKTEFCESSPKLLIDEKLFREVIVNIAQNSLAAIKERFENSLKVPSFKDLYFGVLRLRTSVKNDCFILQIADNGIGMTEEVQSRIFEPYYTTKANGTGLGLAMSYKIIKEFSGDISLVSVLGEGTEFTITLPIPQTNKKLLGHNQ